MENVMGISEFEEKVASAPSLPRTKTKYDYGRIATASFQKGIEEGTSAFLPDKDGFVSNLGAYNMKDARMYHGYYQIALTERQKELGAPTGAFIELKDVLAAQKAGVDCYIRKGEHGLDTLGKYQKGENAGKEVEEKWFNISQIENGENLKKYYEGKGVKYDYYEQKNFDEGFVKANFATAEDYLGQMLVGITTGRKVYVSEEQKEKFKNLAIKFLNQPAPGTDKKNGLAIYALCSKANEYCREHASQFRKKEAPKQEKTETRKRSKPDMDFGIGM